MENLVPFVSIWCYTVHLDHLINEYENSLGVGIEELRLLELYCILDVEKAILHVNLVVR
jgi:hypothetical protein